MATITKITNAKGTTYRAQIRKFKDGKLAYSETKTFRKATMARAWAEKREEELEKPGAMARAKSGILTVRDLIEQYQADFCEGAGRTKAATVKQLLTFDFADLHPSRLTSEVLIAHIKDRRKVVSPSTALNDLVWLRVIFKAAKPAWGLDLDTSEIDAARSFCTSARLVRKSKVRVRRPTEHELLLLDRHFASRDGRAEIPMRDIMWFAIFSARRQAEITALLWSDNDDKHRTGMVRNLKHPRQKEGNDKRFKYTNEAWEIVQRQPKADDRIFPYDPKSVGAAFTRACSLLGIVDLRFHDLRHEATSRLFERGYSIPEVQLFTLHESWAVLQRYVNLRPENLKIRS